MLFSHTSFQQCKGFHVTSVRIKIQEKKLFNGIACLNQDLAITSLGGWITRKIDNMRNPAGSQEIPNSLFHAASWWVHKGKLWRILGYNSCTKFLGPIHSFKYFFSFPFNNGSFTGINSMLSFLQLLFFY